MDAKKEKREDAANAGSAQETREQICKLAQTSNIWFVADIPNKQLGSK
jgi:hypothetical protein